MNKNTYEEFLRETSNHWARRAGSYQGSIECLSWAFNIPGVEIKDRAAFDAFLKERVRKIEDRFNAEMPKI